jgi:hypothetical protein
MREVNNGEGRIVMPGRILSGPRTLRTLPLWGDRVSPL